MTISATQEERVAALGLKAFLGVDGPPAINVAAVGVKLLVGESLDPTYISVADIGLKVLVTKNRLRTQDRVPLWVKQAGGEWSPAYFIPST